jgi:hypothetical protein
MMTAYNAQSVYLIKTKQKIEGMELENKKNWTKILKDMTEKQIKDILGEPERILEGVTTIWFYQKGGSVEFSGGKVIKWTKPYSWDY